MPPQLGAVNIGYVVDIDGEQQQQTEQEIATLEGPHNQVVLPSSPFTEEKEDKTGRTSNSFDQTTGAKDLSALPMLQENHPFSDTIGTVQTHQVMYDSQKEILNIVQDDNMNEDYNNEEYEDDEYEHD